MIVSKNFSGLDTPQDLGSLPAFIVPPISRPVYAPTGIRILALDVRDSSYAKRWIVSDDRSRAWKLKLAVFKSSNDKIVAMHYIPTKEVAVGERLSPSTKYIADFQMTDLPILSDRAFHRCNFTHRVPVDVAGKKRGVKLFPSDATPITFIECNLCNCEPPPGSTVTGCLTVIKEFALESNTETLRVDGVPFNVVHHIDRIHGRLDPATGDYIYKGPPEDIEVD